METLYKLVNPKFQFEFAGKTYDVRKASLGKMVLYQQKVKELSADTTGGTDHKLIGYCIYLTLKDIDPEITETKIMEETPADIDIIECLTQLGFINPNKREMAKKIQETLQNKATTESSSPSL